MRRALARPCWRRRPRSSGKGLARRAERLRPPSATAIAAAACVLATPASVAAAGGPRFSRPRPLARSAGPAPRAGRRARRAPLATAKTIRGVPGRAGDRYRRLRTRRRGWVRTRRAPRGRKPRAAMVTATTRRATGSLYDDGIPAARAILGDATPGLEGRANVRSRASKGRGASMRALAKRDGATRPLMVWQTGMPPRKGEGPLEERRPEFLNRERGSPPSLRPLQEGTRRPKKRALRRREIPRASRWRRLHGRRRSATERFMARRGDGYRAEAAPRSCRKGARVEGAFRGKGRGLEGDLRYGGRGGGRRATSARYGARRPDLGAQSGCDDRARRTACFVLGGLYERAARRRERARGRAVGPLLGRLPFRSSPPDGREGALLKGRRAITRDIYEEGGILPREGRRQGRVLSTVFARLQRARLRARSTASVLPGRRPAIQRGAARGPPDLRAEADGTAALARLLRHEAPGP